MPLVTIVVPVYNVEKYLARCVDSILNQTLQDIEVILVDDGSPDSSGKIADEYAIKDSRIQVIHKVNGGLSSARNAGTRIATSKYVGYVDSDDWVEPETFERLLQTAEHFSTDVVMFDYTRKTMHGDQRHTEKIETGFYDRKKILADIFPNLVMGENIDYGPVLSACSCFYRIEFLRQHNLEFDEDIFFSEDSLFNSKVMEKANSFYYLKTSFYNYFYNKNSITKTYRKEKWANVKILNKKMREHFCNINYYNFEEQINRHMVYFACNTLSQVCHCDKSIDEKREEIKQILMDKKLSSAMKNLQFPLNTWKFRMMAWIMKKRLIYIYSIIFCK
jgi:glycosyltransferase involved in cell wall biosynthesis